MPLPPIKVDPDIERRGAKPRYLDRPLSARERQHLYRLRKAGKLPATDLEAAPCRTDPPDDTIP